jgi:hypothetical protein
VQKELKLSDEQVKKAEEALKRIREKHKTELAAARELPEDEGREKIEILTKTIIKEQMKAISDILSDEQVKRLKQVSLQALGELAFNDPEIQNDLRLTDDQKQRIKKIQEDAYHERQSIRNSEPEAAHSRGVQEKIKALNKETLKKSLDVLTDDQKKAWKDMTGMPLDGR